MNENSCTSCNAPLEARFVCTYCGAPTAALAKSEDEEMQMLRELSAGARTLVDKTAGRNIFMAATFDVGSDLAAYWKFAPLPRLADPLRVAAREALQAARVRQPGAASYMGDLRNQQDLPLQLQMLGRAEQCITSLARIEGTTFHDQEFAHEYREAQESHERVETSNKRQKFGILLIGVLFFAFVFGVMFWVNMKMDAALNNVGGEWRKAGDRIVVGTEGIDLMLASSNRIASIDFGLVEKVNSGNGISFSNSYCDGTITRVRGADGADRVRVSTVAEEGLLLGASREERQLCEALSGEWLRSSR